MPGAETLLGRGDMLLRPADLPATNSLEGIQVTEREIFNIGGHWPRESPATSWA